MSDDGGPETPRVTASDAPPLELDATGGAAVDSPLVSAVPTTRQGDGQARVAIPASPAATVPLELTFTTHEEPVDIDVRATLTPGQARAIARTLWTAADTATEAAETDQPLLEDQVAVDGGDPA